ncbi:hypothetical protein ROE7235_01685 [Roseibaca ekhonensis]|uniref:DUF418 domain-containing protein n=1 Tax=Roseinatronobacter ekhonensis TaxID=254356 RepID=A0A3B0MSX7_9RHOB|nr:DUF418 domain-containing protein [Roseibaca ekhonensis]SUZ31934.1 hypothetical protein ROE7235_01685 [Roseibaca ekhonensis]
MSEQVAMPPRALMPDYLRLIALFGIVIVNVQFIGFSVLHGFAEPMGQSAADDVTLWLINGLALLKTYGLFSFMFGVGLGFLMRSATRRGLPFGKLYRNRMLGLLGLGLLHGCLFFPGDILVIYAVAGSILYLLRDWPLRRLATLGMVLLALQPVIALPLLLGPSDTPPEFFTIEQDALGTGGFLEAALFRTLGFLFTLPVFLIVQGISALGWFCLGLAAVRAGMIDRADHPLWRRARRFCLWPGLALSLLGAAIWQWGPANYGAALTVIVAPVATLGYLGVIAALARPPGPVGSQVLAAGGSSLSIYLGQSIILSTVFSAYGFGLWGQLDRATATAVAVLVTVCLIAALTLWRRWFGQGPFEWLLRRITYAGLRP